MLLTRELFVCFFFALKILKNKTSTPSPSSLTNTTGMRRRACKGANNLWFYHNEAGYLSLISLRVFVKPSDLEKCHKPIFNPFSSFTQCYLIRLLEDYAGLTLQSLRVRSVT